MELSNELISQFVKITNDKDKKPAEKTVYGTYRVSDGKSYVQIDGSTIYTPVTTTVTAKDGDRVTVIIKDHSAVVTGNMTKPSATQEEVEDVKTTITEFDIILADKVTTEQLDATNAQIENLQAANVEISGKVTAVEGEIKDLEADNVKINETLEAHQGQFDSIDTTFIDISGRLTANEAKIETLEATDADFRNLEADYGEFKSLTATRAEVDALHAEKLDVNFANIDTANIDILKANEFYAASGLVGSLDAEDITATRKLVGTTISGDMIEADTIKADKLLLKGENGLYYKMNIAAGEVVSEELTQEDLQDALSGKAIIARSITAEKISVSDLVAFGATIGGFKISGDSEGQVGAIHSVNKPSIDADDQGDARGIYMDNEGQFSVGDATNYLKYYRDADGSWKLAITLESLMLGLNSKNVGVDLANLLERIRMGTYLNPETGNDEPLIEMSEEDSDFKMRLTNTHTQFTDGSGDGTKIDADSVETDTVKIRNEFKQGSWVWKQRANGNYGLQWKGATS